MDMWRIILLLLLACETPFLKLQAQHGVAFDVGQMNAGKNIRAGHFWQINPRLSLESGLKYHINNPNNYDSRGSVYQYAMYADKFVEHFGAYSNVAITAYTNPSKTIRLKIVADAEIGKLGYHRVHFSTSDVLTDTFGNYYLFASTIQHPPIWNFQLSLGLMFQGNINSHLSMMVKLGTGPHILKDYPYTYEDPISGVQTILLPLDRWLPDAIFSPYIRSGFIVHFNKSG
jgi:hypothetical protein